MVFAKQKIPKSYWEALDGGTQSFFIGESAVVFLYLELGAEFFSSFSLAANTKITLE